MSGRLRLPVEPEGLTHIYHQYVVRVTDRDGLRAHLSSRGVGTGNFVLLLIIGWAMAHKEQTRELLGRLRRRGRRTS